MGHGAFRPEATGTVAQVPQGVPPSAAGRPKRAGEPADAPDKPVLEKLDVPGLWLLGGEDRSIPTPATVRILDQLIASGRPFSTWAMKPMDSEKGMVLENDSAKVA